MLDRNIAVVGNRGMAVVAAARPNAILVQNVRDCFLNILTSTRSDDWDGKLVFAANGSCTELCRKRNGSLLEPFPLNCF